MSTKIAKSLPPDEVYLRYLYAVTRQYLDQWRTGMTIYVAELQDAAKRVVTWETLAAGNPVAVIEGLPWDSAAEAAIETWEPLIQGVLNRAGAAELRRLELPLKFDIKNPYATAWAREHAAELVTQVSDETKLALRNLITQSFEDNVDVHKTARNARQWIGLTDRDEQAVLRRWHLLNEQGWRSASRVDTMADNYAKKLLRRRAENIARTETVASSNAGVQASFLQAEAEGYFLPTTVRKWHATFSSDRTCEACMNLNGATVGLREPFYSGVLGKSVMHPPLHPSCRCAISAYTPIPK